jgi:hypothetical protein
MDGTHLRSMVMKAIELANLAPLQALFLYRGLLASRRDTSSGLLAITFK